MRGGFSEAGREHLGLGIRWGTTSLQQLAELPAGSLERKALESEEGMWEREPLCLWGVRCGLEHMMGFEASTRRIQPCRILIHLSESRDAAQVAYLAPQADQ